MPKREALGNLLQNEFKHWEALQELENWEL